MSIRNPLKLLFIINPHSGNNSIPWDETIRNYFTGKHFELAFHKLQKKPDPRLITNSIEDFQPDRVIAVGGDGTVSMIAKLLAPMKIPLGILPAGSANGMAKELEIPTIADEALEIIENGIVRTCDAIQINGEVCLHLSDIGLNAQLIKYFDEGALRGQLGYARVILKTLWRKKKMQVIIQSKNEEITREAFMVVLANASKYGTGAVINPTGSITDGAFEVVIVRKLAVSELLKMLFIPQPFNPKKIETITATSVKIETKSSVHFQVDGEYMGKVKEVNATILPRYIKLILPD